jgi:hypothetical protein
MTDDISRLGRSAHTPEAVGHDDPEWMATFSALDDHEVDGLLAGLPPDDADLAPLAEVAAMLRRSAAAERVPTMSATLRAQLAGPKVVAIAARQAGRSALIKAAAAAAAAAAVVTLGVGATQNRLPSGLQDVLSSTANLVGIHVPTAAERPSHSNGGSEPSDDVDDQDPGHQGTTPGGATPADPGTPGDKEPATPATPPAQSDGRPGETGPPPDLPASPPDLPPPAATPAPATTPPPAPPEGTGTPAQPVTPDGTSAPGDEAALDEPTEPEDPGPGRSSGVITGSSHGNPSEAGAVNGLSAPRGPADPGPAADPERGGPPSDDEAG